jgi:putative transcriptional regulator
MDATLRGQLLIASPALSDYFRRTVVLLVEHGEEGAMGAILNRPSEHLVAETVPALAELADADDVVHAGGPVNPAAVVALGEFDDPDEPARPVVAGSGCSTPTGPSRSRSAG